MKMLFLSRWFPYPSDNGSRQRIAALLRALTQRHEVHLLSFIDHEDALARTMAERAGLTAVHTVPYPKARRSWPFAGLASGGPRSLVQKHSRLMQEYAFDLVVNDRFDVVVASEIDMLPYAVALPVAQRVLDGLEVGMYHDALLLPWLRGGLRARVRWSRLTNYLQRNLAEFMLCTTVSEHERRLIDRHVAPACALIVTPNGVDVSACAQVRGAPRPDTLIYAGALTYAANFDAVEYCITSILPRVRAERPAVRLLVTGAAPPELVARLPSDPSVEYTGYLKDVSVAPVRVGSGTRLKILESMALGVPVVATGKGAEGLELQPGESILIGDDPDHFARHVVDVLRSEELRTAIAVRGQRAVAERYDWTTIGAAFVQHTELIAGAS
jgi:polysaccharide biosynthesis protein PslH